MQKKSKKDLSRLFKEVDDKYPKGYWSIKRWGRKKTEEELRLLETTDLRSWSFENNDDTLWGNTLEEVLQKAINGKTN